MILIPQTFHEDGRGFFIPRVIPINIHHFDLSMNECLQLRQGINTRTLESHDDWGASRTSSSIICHCVHENSQGNCVCT
jgi:hypothetical protein